MPDTVGNNLLSARRIFPIASSQAFTEFVGVEAGALDPADYYTFTLSRSSSVTISLNGLAANADVEILDRFGNAVTGTDGVVLSSTNTGTLAESINTLLSADTYYIRVFPGPATNPLDPLNSTPSTNYSLNVAADPNIKTDIVWRNYTTGQNAIWRMDGTTLVDASFPLAVPPTTNWRTQATGDFTNDSNTDIVWRNYTTGQNVIWVMNGTTLVSAATLLPAIPDLNWQIAGAGDFNADGSTDLLWRNYATGQNAVWLMNGLSLRSAVAIESVTNVNLRIQGVADFNNDNTPDILWRDYSPTGSQTGVNFVWLMNGLTRNNTTLLPTLTDLNFRIQGTGDFNDDGRADVFLRNVSTGENTVWLLNGNQLIRPVSLPTVSPSLVGEGWQAVAPFSRFLPPIRRDIAGASPTSAPFQLGPLNGSGVYYDTIGGVDTNDYFQFSLGSPTSLSISLTGLTGGNLLGDLDMQIYNAFGSIPVVGGVSLQAVNGGNSSEAIATPPGFSLDVGTYYIRIFPKAGQSSPYRLSLNANNLPVLVSKNNLTINEGATAAISNNLLLVSDENNPASQVVYTLVTPPNLVNGSLSLNGAAITTGSTFSQADINTGRLSYRQSGSETLTDNFVFSVTDGVGGTIGNTTFTINTIPVNDAPVLVSNSALIVTEGAAANLTTLNLLVSDVEQPSSQLRYSLTGLPANGSLLLNGVTLTAGNTFTQTDLDSGTRLRYTHNGSETLSDSFSFTVTDGAGGTLTPEATTFSINVTPFNDSPTLVTNRSLTLNQDEARAISSALLSATDAELLDLPDQIVYTVVTGPTRGTLFRDATATTTFTQADLNAGRVFYDHDGSNTNSDSFTFRISDGTNTVPTTTLAPAVFNITVNRTNSPPVLTTNAGLTLAEGATSRITTALLQVSDLDNAPPQIIYTLQSLPSNGRLTRLGAPLTIGQTFTQADIDTAPASRIAYEHNGSETLTDSFSFTASDGSSSSIPATTFNITVTPVNDLPVLVSNRGATLVEGESFLITNGGLLVTDNDNPPPASLVYSVTSAPTNGTLFLGTTAVTTFTQADINSGLLRYQHNGSESVADSFSFTISDGVIPVAIGPNIFNIAITPVNDAPRVSLNSGLTLSEGAAATIGSTALLVTDPDGPNPVSYTLGTTPSRGTLLLGTTTLSTGQTFSQTDLTTGRLSYLHNGSETTSDSFTFTASDGSTGILPTTSFDIRVTPVNDPPVLTIPGAQTLDEDAQLTLTGATRISVSDAENNNPITVNLSATRGTITVSGVGIPGNGTNTVALTGTISAVNTALNSIIYRPEANYNGPDAIILSASDGGPDLGRGTIDVTVLPVNDAPTLTVPTTVQTVNEDATLALAVNTADIDSGDNIVRATVSALNGNVSVAGGSGNSTLNLTGTINDIRTALATLVYQGNPNYNGTDTVTITVNDQGATGSPGPLSVTQTIPINVLAVNDAPSFTGGANQTVNEDSGLQTVAGWATNISRGPVNETSQSLSFVVVNNSNPNLFTNAGQPAIDPITGNLTYRPADNAFGTATITVRLQDNGGTALGGSDVSNDYTFTIAVNAVNDAPTFTRGANITVAEDAPAQSLLWATNISPGPTTPTPPNESTQTVNFLVSNDNPSLFTTGGQPTIAPNGTLSYTLAQDANGIALVTVQLRDSGGVDNGGVNTSAPVTLTINALAVNDAPTLTLPTGTQTVNEDTLLNIPGISINDVDAGNANLLITLTALGPTGASSGGNISLSSTPGVAITGNNSNSVSLSGTLANLNVALGTFAYQGKQDINGINQIAITVNDQGNSPSGPLGVSQTLTVNVTAVNDAPVLGITGGTTRTVAEDTLLTLGGINVTDVDSDPGNVQITVSALQGGLTATATGAATIAGGGTGSLTITGTRTDVNTTLANLRYQGNLNFNGSDTVTVTVNDGGNTGIGGSLSDTKTLNINVTPVNDLPTLTLPTGPLAVNEDTNLLFTGATAIALNDVDSGTNPVRITLAVNNGTLNLATAGLTTISGANGTRTATYEGAIADIIAALNSLVYRGNLNYNGPDQLTITVNDNGSTGSPPPGTNVTQTVDLTVTPVNDSPVLVTNNSLTLNEGASQVITNGLLRTTDADNPPATALVYTIQSGGPGNGTLVVNGSTLGAGGTFTQDDINRGVVRYFHNGSETLSDSFTFQVSDGGSAPITDTFRIGVNSINDVPILVNRQPLTVTEGQVATISNTQLLVTDPDNTAAQLQFTITNLPSSGNVRLNGSNLTTGQTFTQQDINLGRVSYRHNGSETTSDSFTFVASDGGGGNIGSTSFNLNISPVNDSPLIVSNGPLTVAEGAIANITPALLQTNDPEGQPLTYRLLATPLRGILSRDGVALNQNDTFTQAEINAGRISYQHDGSEQTNDAFFYSVTDGSTTVNQIFNIGITPVNDQPQFLTANPTITVAGDVPSITEISAGILSTTDVDNTPSQIVYRLVTAPNSTFGQLRLNGSPLLAGQTFTQADIDAGRVTYQSAGGGSTDTFQFDVSDGGVGGTLPVQFFTIIFSYPNGS